MAGIPGMKDPVAAIDARLAGTRNTGDTSYWRGLIWGLSQICGESQVTLFGDAPRPAELGDCPFRWVEVHAANPRLWSLVALPRAAKESGADVLHTQYNVSPLTACPAVTTIHDVSFFVNPLWYGWKDRLLLTRGLPASCRRAKQILAVSETTKCEIEQYIPAARGKVAVTFNALGPGFTPMDKPAAKASLKGRFGIETPFVFAITSPWARKNSRLAGEAFSQSRLAETHRLVTCGPGGAIQPGSLHLGYVDDDTIRDLYAAADCFLLPSLHEGFGIPILESFASGTPVVCGPGGAIPEVASDAAWVCPDYRPETWAGTLDRLFDDSGKLEAMVAKGRDRVRDFSWLDTAAKTWEAYGRAAAGG